MGGLGRRGVPHHAGVPRLAPTPRRGTRREAKGQGQDKGPNGTSVFATPVLWDAKGLRGSSAASEQYDPGGL